MKKTKMDVAQAIDLSFAFSFGFMLAMIICRLLGKL